MKIAPPSEFTSLAKTKGEEFFLWQASSYESGRFLALVVAVFWSVVVSKDDGPSVISLFCLASWALTLMGFISHSVLHVLRRQLLNTSEEHNEVEAR